MSKDMIKLFFFNKTTLGLMSLKIYLKTLKWDVLPHPPYSPDIAPSYWLFRRINKVIDSLLLQKSKIESPKTSHFFEMEFENCLRDGKK